MSDSGSGNEDAQQVVRDYRRMRGLSELMTRSAYIMDVDELATRMPSHIERVFVICGHQSRTRADFRAEFAVPQLRMMTDVFVSIRDVEDIVRALQSVRDQRGTVVIIHRGGGYAAEFDHADVVRAIIDCPVPVITAVGHAEDLHLADAVAAAAFPTPTKAAVIFRKLLGRQYYQRRHQSSLELVQVPTAPAEYVPPASVPYVPPQPDVSLPRHAVPPFAGRRRVNIVPKNWWGTLSLLCGIVSILTAGGFGILPLVGLILGLEALRWRRRRVAITGLILNAIALWVVVAVR